MTKSCLASVGIGCWPNKMPVANRRPQSRNDFNTTKYCKYSNFDFRTTRNNSRVDYSIAFELTPASAVRYKVHVTLWGTNLPLIVTPPSGIATGRGADLTVEANVTRIKLA